MKVLVSEKLSEHKYKTPEGYLICTDAILARTGKQSYTKDELFQDGDNTEVNVDRPYDEVMNAKTIASFENKPITFDHPDEDVNVGNYKDYAIGYVRDVHQGKTDKGEDVILGNLVITDQDAINAIEQGDHTDLSCGYDCDIRDDGNGNYSQTNIRGNHLALCEQGRAGIAHIVDSKVKDKENLLGKRVRIRKRYSNLDGTIGKIYSYEGTNYDDDVEVERNGHIYKVNYEDIEFLDSKVEDASYDYKRILREALRQYNKSFSDLDDDNLYNKIKSYIENKYGKDAFREVYDYLTNYINKHGSYKDNKVEDEQFVIYEKDFNKYYDGQYMYASYNNAKKYNSFNEAVRALTSYGITKHTQALILGATSGKTYAETVRGQLKAYDSKVNDEHELIEIVDRLKANTGIDNYRIKEGKNKNNGHHITQYVFDRSNLVVYDETKDEIIGLIENGKVKINKLHDAIVDSKIEDAITTYKYKFEYDTWYHDWKTREEGFEHHVKVGNGRNAYEAAINAGLDKDDEIVRVYKEGKLLKSFTSRHVGEWHGRGKIEALKNIVEDSKEMTMSDAIKMLNIVDAYKKVRDISKDKWIIKNTGLAYEVWNQGKLIKKFPAKKLAIEWIHSRFPTDEITEDSTKDGKLWTTLTRKAKHR